MSIAPRTIPGTELSKSKQNCNWIDWIVDSFAITYFVRLDASRLCLKTAPGSLILSCFDFKNLVENENALKKTKTKSDVTMSTKSTSVLKATSWNVPETCATDEFKRGLCFFFVGCLPEFSFIFHQNIFWLTKRIFFRFTWSAKKKA